ncbi:MAG: hypothetical protein R8N23_20025 [Reichenbachiella sp.]|uniref:hypothetical protein n=1 Tax=Reichenbachiella sp. TaxID=2184521 RepID=UPI00296767CA|nr:hypothetical protein [Reichenbachiella sp.]MDW3212168.1 hypothetical protein [Reichenbachiella sp.]
MKLEQFIRERIEPKNGKYKTVNVDEDLHLFLKRTANHYNIAMSDLIFNILINWMKSYQSEIKNDMQEQFGE